MTSSTKTLEEDIQALRGDVSALVESVSKLVTGTAEAAQQNADSGLNGAARAGKEFMADAGKFKSDSVHAAQEAAHDASSLLAGEIRRNPFVAVAAALAVGFVAGIAQRR